MKQGNTRVISLIMFYDNRESPIFKVLGVVVYCFFDKYVCIDYLSLQRESKFSLPHRKFEDTSFDEISGIGTPENLLNIVSCYGFVQYEISTLILTCRRKLVSYYLSKGLVILNQYYQSLKNVPPRLK